MPKVGLAAKEINIVTLKEMQKDQCVLPDSDSCFEINCDDGDRILRFSNMRKYVTAVSSSSYWIGFYTGVFGGALLLLFIYACIQFSINVSGG